MVPVDADAVDAHAPFQTSSPADQQLSRPGYFDVVGEGQAIDRAGRGGGGVVAGEEKRAGSKGRHHDGHDDDQERSENLVWGGHDE